jgi:hypothetical protein
MVLVRRMGPQANGPSINQTSDATGAQAEHKPEKQSESKAAAAEMTGKKQGQREEGYQGAEHEEVAAPVGPQFGSTAGAPQIVGAAGDPENRNRLRTTGAQLHGDPPNQDYAVVPG